MKNLEVEVIKSVPENYLTTYMEEKVPGNAELIAFPKTTQEVSELLKEANDQNKKVIAVGHRTGLTSATYPTEDIWLISLEKMNKIKELDENTMTLVVEAGVSLEEIREYLKDTPYFYAPDPGAKEASVGGNASTNAGGMRAIKYGVTRDNIRGYDVVLADGRVIHVGSLNKKNATGYDLKDLFIGAEGTLGILTEFQLKLTPKPAFNQSILVGFEDLDHLAPLIYEIIKSSLEPAALELLEESGMYYSKELTGQTIPDVEGAVYLLATLEGNNQASIEQQAAELNTYAKQAAAKEFRILTDEESEAAWKVRDNILNGVVAQGEWKMYDPVVPNNYFTNLVIEAKEFGEQFDIQTAFFGHAGDGNVHICIMRRDETDEEWENKKANYEAKIYPIIAEFGGLPSAEHGLGLEKKEHIYDFFSEDYIDVLRSIKLALDPKNTLNPGKVFDLE